MGPPGRDGQGAVECLGKGQGAEEVGGLVTKPACKHNTNIVDRLTQLY